MQYSFRHIDKIEWTSLEKSEDCTVFKTKAWSDFLYETFGVRPYIIEITDENGLLAGWFYGEIIKKIGIKILASPFEGWTTSYQGLSLQKSATTDERMEIYSQLRKWCFDNRICSLLQISDWQLRDAKLNANGFKLVEGHSIYLNISADENTLYRSFKQKSAQYAIHKAERLGVVVKEATGIGEFSHNYYSQLLDVFAKQDLTPTYDERRVSIMLKHLIPQGKVVALEALHPESGKSMATILFVFHNKLAFYWGAASWREYQKFCPNELLFFEAIKILKQHGVETIEMEGKRKYKEKYNPVEYSNSKLVAARYPIIITMKDMAKQCYYTSRDIMSKTRKIWQR